MNETEQLSLSRYVDGDLSPLERKKVEAMLDADPAARRMMAEYSRMSQYVKELPRDPLNEDLVPLIRVTLARKRRFATLPAKSPLLAGLLAASVLIATFTISYVALPRGSDRGVTSVPGSRVEITGSKPSAVREEHSVETTAADDHLPPIAGTSEIAAISAPPESPNVAMALSQSATRLGEQQLAENKVPSQLEDRFLQFRKATDSTDRKHSFRLHVPSASERQIDSILSVIGRFRTTDSSVLERKTIGENKKLSLSFVALIPTGRMADFRAALRRLPGIDVEQDKPESFFSKLDAGNSKDIRFVESVELDRATRSFGQTPPSTASDTAPPPLKKSPDHDVPDAISQPLKVEAGNEADSGTLDEVTILIRTDPLSVGKQAPPTRPD